MTRIDELKTMIRRNMCLGIWAAEKLGLVGEDAEVYAKNLAVGTLDAEDRDVFSKIRSDFDAAGVIHSDEEILQVMNDLTLQAAGQTPATKSEPGYSAAILLARKLSPRA